MKILNIYTEQTEELETLLDMHGVIYNVEYIPSKHKKVNHFGEVYAQNEKKQSQFSLFDNAEFVVVKELLSRSQIAVVVEEVENEEINYQQQFEDEYPIIEVGHFLICPPWNPQDSSDKIQLIIPPSTGFGTGHSPTTQLCLQWISKINFTNQRVLDFGSGSGILAIAAAKNKAESVVALEIDPDAMRAAQYNVELNHCETQISVVQSEKNQYDILLMNVTADILQSYLNEVWSRIAKFGYLSGVHQSQYDEICHFLNQSKIQYTIYKQDEWYGFEVRK